MLLAAETEKARSAESTAQIKTLQEQLAQASKEEQPRPPNIDQRVNRGGEVAVRRGGKRSEPERGNDVVSSAASAVFELNQGSVRSEGGSGNNFKIPKTAKGIHLASRR